jgi:hypothetical protein
MSDHPDFFVVIGDVHSQVALALRALTQIEQEQGRRIAQVFSVGDLGLFLCAKDWNFFTGPRKHRHLDWSPGDPRVLGSLAVAAGHDWRQPRAMAQASSI